MKKYLFVATVMILLFEIRHNGFSQEGKILQEKRESVEPITIEETLPNEVGEWSFRLSLEYPVETSERSITIPRVQSFFGIMHNLGAEINFPFTYNHTGHRYSLPNVSGSLKWLLLGLSEATAAIVLGFEAGIPLMNSDQITGERAYELRPFIAALNKIGGITLQGNIGMVIQIPVKEDVKSYAWEYNGSIAIPFIEEKLHLHFEGSGMYEMKNKTNDRTFSTGLKYHFNDNMFTAIAFSFGLDTPKKMRLIITQFQMRI